MAADNAGSGEQMSRQVLHLLSGVSSHGDQHLTEVERDLAQMDGLLEEAIKKLCTSFMAIHATVATQQQDLARMMAEGAPPEALAAQMETIRAEIDRHVGAAMTGLQFQDMTSQLIARMLQHLTGLRDVFGALDANAPDHAGNDDVLDVLDQISDRVGTRCSEISEGVRSTVKQRHMESGDIELF